MLVGRVQVLRSKLHGIFDLSNDHYGTMYGPHLQKSIYTDPQCIVNLKQLQMGYEPSQRFSAVCLIIPTLYIQMPS